jgi:hypothetical protein
MRWLCALVVGAVLTGFAFLLLTGRYLNDGGVVVSLGGGHGLHVGDFFVLAGWGSAMTALVVLARRPGRRVPT